MNDDPIPVSMTLLPPTRTPASAMNPLTAAASRTNTSTITDNVIPTVAELSMLDDRDTLRARIFALEETNDELWREVAVTHQSTKFRLEKEIAKLKSENQTLRLSLTNTHYNYYHSTDRQKIDELEAELLALQCRNFDLNFVSQTSSVKLSRYQTRIRELTVLQSLLSAYFHSTNSLAATDSLLTVEVQGLVRQLVESSGGDSEVFANAGSRDLLSILGSFQRAVQRVLAANRELRASSDQWQAKARERDLVEKQLLEVKEKYRQEKETSESLSKDIKELKPDYSKLLALHSLQKKELKKAREKCQLLASEFRTKEKLYADECDALRRQIQSAENEQRERESDREQSEIQALKGDIRDMLATIEAVKSRHREVVSKFTTQLGQLQRENQALREENAAYASELSAFDEAFFEEIEELKYRYAQAIQIIQQTKRGSEATSGTGASTSSHLDSSSDDTGVR